MLGARSQRSVPVPVIIMVMGHEFLTQLHCQRRSHCAGPGFCSCRLGCSSGSSWCVELRE
eukprot:1030339-Rhodomonas_salina.1